MKCKAIKNILTKGAVVPLLLLAMDASVGYSPAIHRAVVTGHWKTTGEPLSAPRSGPAVQYFGRNLAASRNWLFVGADYGSRNQDYQMIYVYHWQSGRWNYVQGLSVDTGGMRSDIALGKDIAFLEGYVDEGKNEEGRKSVIFIYRWNGEEWKEKEVLPVHASGELIYTEKRLFVRDGDNGFVTIFERRGNAWHATEKIDTHTDELPIGANFSASSGRFIALSHRADESLRGGNAVFVYEREANGWTRTATISPTGRFSGYLFASCAMASEGKAIFVVAVRPVPTSEFTDKSVYQIPRRVSVLMYEERRGQWQLAAMGGPTQPELAYSFGEVVKAFENELFVGAPSASVTSDGYSNGVVYVFRKQGKTLKQVGRLSAGHPKEAEGFGSSMAWARNMLMVAAPAAGTQLLGAVYIFDRQQK